MKLINLTPHAVRVIRAGGDVVIPPSGGVARCQTAPKAAGELTLATGEIIPLTTTAYGPVVGLPATEPGVGLIVSTLVRLALPSRGDLFSPAELVRDEKGAVVGCSSLEGNQ